MASECDVIGYPDCEELCLTLLACFVYVEGAGSQAAQAIKDASSNSPELGNKARVNVRAKGLLKVELQTERGSHQEEGRWGS